MDRGAFTLEKAHPLAAACNQHAFGLGHLQETLACALQALHVAHGLAERRFGLRLIGRQRSHALEAREIAMGVHDDDLFQFSGERQDGPDDRRTDDAIVIVR